MSWQTQRGAYTINFILAQQQHSLTHTFARSLACSFIRSFVCSLTNWHHRFVLHRTILKQAIFFVYKYIQSSIKSWKTHKRTNVRTHSHISCLHSFVVVYFCAGINTQKFLWNLLSFFYSFILFLHWHSVVQIIAISFIHYLFVCLIFTILIFLNLFIWPLAWFSCTTRCTRCLSQQQQSKKKK